ncbi:MAG: Coenzyme F420 hydrogenase/dehydrogenase, beta subunit C-terminal domain [Promethearchaeia archaeon]
MTENEVKEDETKYEYSFDYIQKKLEGKKDSYGKLMKEVIRTGICTECGTCAAVCPVLEWDHVKGQPRLVGKCTGCGICYNQCPRTITDPVQLIGEFDTGYVANTDIPEVLGYQDGGTVTSLLCYLFDEKLIDAAVVTMKDPDNPWYPVAQIVTNKDDAIKAAGSIYCHSQTVEALMEAIREDYRSIAFVGTPCNINAVDKMMNSPAGMLRYFMRAHVLKIGLFCMDSFSPESLYPMFEKDGVDLEKVEKMDINKGKFHVYYDEDDDPVKSYSIKSLHKYKSSSCNFCTDLACENADISVGSVGSEAKKNTVFARSGIGTEIIEDAAEKEYLTIKPYNEINLNSVLFLAKLKKVSQYNIQKRKVFIVRDMEEEEEEERMETKPEDTKTKHILESRRALSVRKKFDEEDNIIHFTIQNTVGFILENVKIRVVTLEDMFEKNPWVTNIKELFPYETIEIDYQAEDSEGDVLLEAVSDEYGKIYSKTRSFGPK